MKRGILVLGLLLLAVGALALSDPRLHVTRTEFGYWAPEIHQLYLRVAFTLDAAGADEAFTPGAVQIDGKAPLYVFWYADNHTIDYGAEPQASKRQMQAFIPICWRGGAQYAVSLRFYYAGKEGNWSDTLAAPAGGAWAPATGGGLAFLVREEAGLARSHEPVEFDMTVPRSEIPDPARGIRATIMRAPGLFEEIPCQVYEVDPFGQVTRFRAVVPLSVKAKSSTLVHLWACPPRDAPAGPVRLDGAALGGTVTNTDYTIEIDKQSGQIYRWQDHRLHRMLDYVDPRKDMTPNATVIHRTPDVYRTGAPWSHAFDWKTPSSTQVTGPVFVDTTRWGTLPDTPEIFARVNYRFTADRPEVRVASSMRVTKDLAVMGFRMGGIILTGTDYTHVAWPKQDGTIVRVPVADALGNDMGAPPQARFPFDTPWFAFYNKEQKFGIALVTANLAYFTEGPGQPNASQMKAYASWYRHYGLYTIRSANQTYCANVYTLPTPMKAGTILYEDLAYLPFSFDREDSKQFRAVEDLLKRLRNPLEIVP